MGNALSAPSEDESSTAPGSQLPRQQQQHLQADHSSRHQRPSLRRRISTLLGRSGSSDSVNKRERSNSSQQSLAIPKRRRVSPADGLEIEHQQSAPQPLLSNSLDPREPREDESMYSPPLSLGGPSAGPSRADSAAQSVYTAHSQVPSRRDTLIVPDENDVPSPRTPASPATDELLSDRLRSISTIQDTLGDSLAPEWTPNVPPAAAPSLLSRFRRREEPSASTSSPSANGSAATSPSSSQSGTNRFAHRLSAIMGLATPDRRQSPNGRRRSSAPAPPEGGIGGLSDSAGSAGAAGPDASPAAPAPGAASTEEENGGIPVGAVLVIQGLAQTHAHPLEGSENDQHPPIDLESLDQQARMIGNLLTVAAAATATTLLSPESLNTQPSRSTAQSAMQNIIERLRPSRTRANQSVESALGEYLRSVLRDNRRFADAVTGEMPSSANIPAEFQGFLHTLQEDLIQAVRAYAVPEGQAGSAAGAGSNTEATGGEAEATAGTSTEAEGATEAAASQSIADVDMPGAFEPAAEAQPAVAQVVNSEETTAGASTSAAEAGAEPAPAAPDTTTSSEAAPDAAPADAAPTDAAPPTTSVPDSAPASDPAPTAPNGVPTYHPQLIQNLPMANLGRGLGVSGGTDGTPRRLNLFRAHRVPTVHENGSSATDADDDAIVPSIFVGVRSIAHNPTLTTEDLVAHPSFPFMDGQVPEESVTASGVTEAVPAATTAPSSNANADDAPNFDRDLESELASSPAPAPAATTSSRRSLRERVFERLGGSSSNNNNNNNNNTVSAHATTRNGNRPQTPMNTYLIYVIGGNYPRSHPVLAIPALVSGAPLTAEDLQLVSELLGPARPPTVTQEEIDAAGLTIMRGSELRNAQIKGQVLESSVERCMVCLADYEPEDACRVLKCRHAFHTECVDQWLTTGRNSCPSCRTEGGLRMWKELTTAVDKDVLPKPEPIPAVEDADAV